MNSPEISVCIPTYNGENYIEECLLSIANQNTKAHIEVIISDDGSQDNTVPLIQQIASSCPKVKWALLKKKAPTGMGQNWNTALKTATAPLIKTIGQDDILLPNCLETESSWFQNKEISLVWSPRILQIHKTRIPTRPKLKPGPYCKSDIIEDLLHKGRNPIGEPITGMFRKDTITQGNLFDPELKYWIDLDFWLKALDNGLGQSLHTPNSVFRIHGASVSKSAQHLSKKEYLKVLSQHTNKSPSAYALFYVGASAFGRQCIYQAVKLLTNKKKR